METAEKLYIMGFFGLCRKPGLEELDQWGKELYYREQVVEERIRAMDKLLPSLTPRNCEKMQNKINRKIGHNEPCTCGSGKKYKKCCGHS